MIRHAGDAQGFFQRTRLVIAAIEDGELVPARFVLLGQMRNLGGDTLGLVLVIATLKHADRWPFGRLAPEFFLKQMIVVGDQRIGHAQDASPAAVVLFEFDHLELRIVTRKLAEVLGIRATPGVDALIIVADCGKHAALTGQRLDQAVLCRVGILILIEQQIADAFLPRSARLVVAFKDLQRQADQVVKIDRIEGGETLLVGRIDRCRLALAHTAGVRLRLLRRQALVLGARNQ